MLINLNESDYIAEGNTRACYTHPENQDLCIKVNKSNTKSNQNSPEIFYLKFKINKKNKSAFATLPECKGMVNTNFGNGLAYELVKDYDKKKSKSLAYYYKNNTIKKSDTFNMIMELYNHCLKHNILIYDANMSNILLQKLDNDKFALRIIDGFGGRKLNINLIMRMIFRYLSKKKTTQSFNHLLFRLENYTLSNDPSFLSE